MIRALHIVALLGPLCIGALAHADISFEAFSSPAPEMGPAETQAAEAAVRACLEAETDYERCVGVGMRSCSGPKSQCYYLEAGAWERAGYGFFTRIAGKLSAAEPLVRSQETWNRFAQAECALTASVFEKEPVLQRDEAARCRLVLTALRTSHLRAHALNLTDR